MEVLCVDMADAGLQVESGRIYATRRTLDGGQTYETITTGSNCSPKAAGRRTKKSSYPASPRILGSRYTRWGSSTEFFAGLNKAADRLAGECAHQPSYS
jgi:hypothetical protein